VRYDAATLQITEARAAARAAGAYGAPHATDLYNLVRGRVADPTTGCVDVTEQELARQLRRSRQTIWRTNEFLVKAGVLTVSMRHDPRTGYRCGLRYTVRGTAYVPALKQQDLPFKSRTSSALRAPRPLTLATWKFVILACWTVFETQPDRELDVASVRTWLTQQGAETTDAIIERAITVQAWQYRQAQQRQRPLPLVGAVPRRHGPPPCPHPSIGTDRLWRRLYAEQDALKERSA
jgi:hypothetical protein